MRNIWFKTAERKRRASSTTDWASVSLSLSLCFCLSLAGSVCPATAQATVDEQWQSLMNNAASASKEGRHADAEELYREALAHALQLDPRSEMVEKSEAELAAILFRNGKFPAAEVFLSDVVANLVRQSHRGDSQARRKVEIDLQNNMERLGDCYRVEGKYKQAEETYRKALKQTRTGAQDEVTAAELKSDLADVLTARGKYKEAESFYKQALPVLEKAKANEQLLDLLEEYQTLLRINDRIEEAEKLSEKINSLRNLNGTGNL